MSMDIWFKAKVDWGEALGLLSDTEAGRFAKALWRYAATGQAERLNGREQMLFALVLGGYDSKPATIALNELAGTMAAEFNVQMAGSLILALPVLVLYIFMGKYLISGQMSGAVTAS